MNLKPLIFLAVAAALAGPVAAQAPQKSPGGDTMSPPMGGTHAEAGASAQSGFTALDRNDDGYLSRDEAKSAPWATRFSEIDKDNDGRVSRSELDALQGAARGATTGKKPAK